MKTFIKPSIVSAFSRVRLSATDIQLGIRTCICFSSWQRAFPDGPKEGITLQRTVVSSVLSSRSGERQHACLILSASALLFTRRPTIEGWIFRMVPIHHRRFGSILAHDERLAGISLSFLSPRISDMKPGSGQSAKRFRGIMNLLRGERHSTLGARDFH